MIKLIKAIAGILFTYFVLRYAYFYFTPQSYWFHYYSVEPAQPVMSKDSIQFISDADVRHKHMLAWNDILYCRQGDGEFKFTTNYESQKYQTESRVDKRRVVSTWKYKPISFTDIECYLQSEATAILPFNIKKEPQITQSSLFKIQ